MRKFDTWIYSKFNRVLDKCLVSLRQRQLNNKDFSIICNNCWAGYVYRRYGLPYRTPTVGLYFFAEDFIKLCSNVKGYIEKSLEFIPYTQSKYREILQERKQTEVPIARLGDIEIIFLHYATAEEAAEKWNRRAARINYDNLIFKFSKMNDCTEEHLLAFDQLNVAKKICFVPVGDSECIRCGIPIRSATGDMVLDDTAEYSRYVDLTKLINSRRVSGSHMEGKWTENDKKKETPA